MAAGSSLASNFTQIPAGLLTSAGLSLFPIAAFVSFVASCAPFWPLGALLVIVGNIVWILAKMGLLARGAIKPNFLGVAFVVVVESAAVAPFSTLEYAGLDRQQTAKSANVFAVGCVRSWQMRTLLAALPFPAAPGPVPQCSRSTFVTAAECAAAVNGCQRPAAAAASPGGAGAMAWSPVTGSASPASGCAPRRAANRVTSAAALLGAKVSQSSADGP